MANKKTQAIIYIQWTRKNEQIKEIKN